ncbi:MAG: hypothetical protein PWQ55_2727, partial [Chloroflexota bacterium]|nr:hypothetical protein [Chloroflexota bacterium]
MSKRMQSARIEELVAAALTVPQADAQFRQSLRDELLRSARLSEESRPQRRNRTWLWLPTTLVILLIVIALTLFSPQVA